MIVVALDGPSGSGKSSTSKEIAIRAGWNYLDTGALYRAVTFIALSINSEKADDILTKLELQPITFNSDPRDPRIFIGDLDITQEIRSHEVTEKVSVISALPEVRAELLTLQRSIIKKAERGIVVEGRDIATVVFPNAVLKVFLTASPEVRAQRRVDQDGGDVAQIAASIAERDLLDSTREDSPLASSSDSVVVDTSDRAIDDVVDEIEELFVERTT